jgi:hypothetical protein
MCEECPIGAWNMTAAQGFFPESEHLICTFRLVEMLDGRLIAPVEGFMQELTGVVVAGRLSHGFFKYGAV